MVVVFPHPEVLPRHRYLLLALPCLDHQQPSHHYWGTAYGHVRNLFLSNASVLSSFDEPGDISPEHLVHNPQSWPIGRSLLLQPTPCRDMSGKCPEREVPPNRRRR